MSWVYFKLFGHSDVTHVFQSLIFNMHVSYMSVTYNDNCSKANKLLNTKDFQPQWTDHIYGRTICYDLRFSVSKTASKHKASVHHKVTLTGKKRLTCCPEAEKTLISPLSNRQVFHCKPCLGQGSTASFFHIQSLQW